MWTGATRRSRSSIETGETLDVHAHGCTAALVPRNAIVTSISMRPLTTSTRLTTCLQQPVLRQPWFLMRPPVHYKQQAADSLPTAPHMTP